MDNDLKRALEATEFMDGMTIEGNNFKVTQFLSLREHLIVSVERCEALEMMLGNFIENGQGNIILLSAAKDLLNKINEGMI